MSKHTKRQLSRPSVKDAPQKGGPTAAVPASETVKLTSRFLGVGTPSGFVLVELEIPEGCDTRGGEDWDSIVADGVRLGLDELIIEHQVAPGYHVSCIAAATRASDAESELAGSCGVALSRINSGWPASLSLLSRRKLALV